MPSGRRCLVGISIPLYGYSVNKGGRTLDISDGLVEDGLEGLGALELLLDLGDDGLGELALRPLLDLALVADPAVEDGLGLVRDGGLLLQLVGLGLELGGLLRGVSCPSFFLHFMHPLIYDCGGRFVPWKPRTGSW